MPSPGLCSSGLSQLAPGGVVVGPQPPPHPPALKVSGPMDMIYFKDEDRDIEAILHQLSWLETAPPLVDPATGQSLGVPPPLGGPLSRSTDCLLAAPQGPPPMGPALLEPLRSTSMINVADDARLDEFSTGHQKFRQKAHFRDI